MASLEIQSTTKPAFEEKVRAWGNQVEMLRQNSQKSEVSGFKLIEGFIKEKFADDQRRRQFQIDNETVADATVSVLGIIGTTFQPYFLQYGQNGFLEISKPQGSYGVTSGIAISLRRGGTRNQWDGLDITLNYSDGYQVDLDTGRKTKTGNENASVKITYVPGYLSKTEEGGQPVYQLEEALGAKCAELFRESDTLTRLKFVMEFLSRAFSRNPTEIFFR